MVVQNGVLKKKNQNCASCVKVFTEVQKASLITRKDMKTKFKFKKLLKFTVERAKLQ